MAGLFFLFLGLAIAAPWIIPDMLDKVDYRPSDIIISVPAKSGTTWTMNMVHQLRSGGDANFTDIYWEVPWIEFVEHPEQSPQELLSRWEHFPRSIRRAFKVHAYPPALPYLPDVKYVVVVRNGLDALASMIPFMHAHTEKFWNMWFPDHSPVPDATEVAKSFMIDSPKSGANFLKAWWPMRHNANVFMVHYSDLIADLPKVLRNMAKFLEIEVAESQWPAIEEHCSFAWMKKNSVKFELTKVLKDVPAKYGERFPLLKPEGLVRLGQSGTGRALGKELIDEFVADATSLLTPEQYEWYMNGGVLPPLSAAETGQKQDL